MGSEMCIRDSVLTFVRFHPSHYPIANDFVPLFVGEWPPRKRTSNSRDGSGFSCPQTNYYAVGFAVRCKSTFRYVRMSFRSENVGNRSLSPQNEKGFSPISIQSCSPLLLGVSCRKSPLASFRSNWVTIHHRIEKKRFSFRSEIVIVFDRNGSKQISTTATNVL